MPVLTPQSNLKKVFLPSTATLADDDPDKGWVVIEAGPLTAGDITDANQDSSEVEISLGMLASRIKDWNYTDTTLNPLPITKENIRLLPVSDFAFLVQQLDLKVEGLTAAEKKT